MKNGLKSFCAALGAAVLVLGLVNCANTSDVNLGKGQNLSASSNSSSQMLITKHGYMDAPPPGRLNGNL